MFQAGLLCSLALLTATMRAEQPDAVLTGSVSAADHHTYREIPFQVPAGT